MSCTLSSHKRKNKSLKLKDITVTSPTNKPTNQLYFEKMDR